MGSQLIDSDISLGMLYIMIIKAANNMCFLGHFGKCVVFLGESCLDSRLKLS